MKRPITNLVMGCLVFFAMQLAAQPTFTVSPQTITANPGQTITVDITTSNFNNLVSFQYSMNWPASVLQFVSPVGNITTQLSGFTSANFGTNGTANGQLSVSWFDPNVQGVSLPNGTTLYSLTFQVLTSAQATISFSGTPTIVEVVNGAGNTVTPTFQNAVVNGGGTGGGGGGTNGFAVIASDETTGPGTSVCVDVTVNDFDNIVSMQYTMQFDPTKFQYTSVQGFGLPDLTAANFGTSNANNGFLNFSWFDQSTNGVTRPDNHVIYQVCFNAIGANSCGSTTQLQFNGAQTTVEVTNTTGQVPFQGVAGDLEICGGAPPGSLTFVASDETSPNGSQVCVDFSVLNFNSIVSAQYSIQFNQAILQYSSVQGFGLPDLTAANFGTGGANNGTLSFSWFDQSTNGITVPNGTVIYQVCFNVIGTTGQTSQVSFNGTPTIIEVTNSANQSVQPFFDAGSVTVGSNCAGPVSITNNVVTNVACFGQSNGSIDITVAGGSAQKTYVWKNVGGATIATTEDVSGLAPGTYSVTVTSCGGQQTTTGSYTVTQPSAPLAINQQITNVDCFGQTNGAINITVTGGTPTGPGCSGGYTYIWSNNATTQDISGLAAGSYTVTITDCRGCQLTPPAITVAGPTSLLSHQATATPVTCFGNSNGTIIVTNTTGGVGPYQYSLNTGAYQSAANFSNLTAGNYNVNVRDALNCLRTISVTVGTPNDIVITTNPTNATSGNCNGAISTTVTGGSPGAGYMFSWSGPSGPVVGGGQNLSNLCPGTYCVTVTDMNNCTKTKCQLVSAPLSLAVASKKDACFGTCDGSINLNVTGGVPPITYAWSNAFTGPNPAGLCSGSYTVTVTSTGNNSTQTLTVNITQASSVPSIVADVLQDPTSSTVCNGTVNISQSTGGFGQPFTYSWSNNQTGTSVNGLCDGLTYTVTVSDAQGCTGTKVYLPNFSPAILTSSFIPSPSCQNAGNGSLNVQLTGGIAPFSISIQGPSGTLTQSTSASSVTFNNLLPGAYNVTITDGASGVDQQQINTSATVPAVNLTINPVIVTPATATSSGAINITAGGGSLPYNYQWSNASTAQDPSGLAPNIYELTMNDGNGCFQVFEVEVGLFKAELASQLMPTCPDETGSLTAAATGSDNTPYQYVWRNAANQVVSQTAQLQNQPVGTYTLQITDSQGTVITQSFAITPVSNLTSNATTTSNFNGFNVRCHNGSSGAATVAATNGDAPYTYAWSNGSVQQSVSSLTAGTYNVTVTDDQGCQVTSTLNVTQPPAFVLETDGSLSGCSENSGIASVFVNGGVPAYTYVWSDPQNQKSATAILLRGGNYRVTITDANQCTAIGDAFVPSPEPLTITGLSVPDSGGPNGQAIAQVNGGTWPFEFEWMGYLEQDSILTELLPDRYIVKVTDFYGCEALQIITVGDETQCGEVLTVITPEGDGFNEEFLIGCLSRFSDNRLEIYNRYGQLVYDADNYNDGNLWRGTDRRGKDVPDGVYFYVFDYLDPANNQRVVKKGNVTVLRK